MAQQHAGPDSRPAYKQQRCCNCQCSYPTLTTASSSPLPPKHQLLFRPSLVLTFHHPIMSPAPAVKRQLSQLDQGSLTSKKSKKVESCPTSFCTMSDQVVVGAPLQLDFSFEEELAHDFIGTPVSGNEIKESSFDPLFDDTPLDIIPLQETSDVSSDEGKIEKDEKQEKDSISAGSAAGEGQDKNDGESRNNTSEKDDDSQKKRQADKAARNRESSRRAREKQKNRFRALESGYLALQETVQRYKLQIEHLQSLLDRAHAVQQSCPVCSYNSTLVGHSGRQDCRHS